MRFLSWMSGKESLYLFDSFKEIVSFNAGVFWKWVFL